MKKVLSAFSLLVLLTAVSFPSFVVAQGPGNEVVASLSGSAYVDVHALDITINASRLKNGLVSGTSSVPGNFDGKVLELVSPFGARDFWCVNVIVTNPEANRGANWFWFVREVPSGPDEVAFNSFFDDTACSDFPDATGLFFGSATSGDFTSEVVNICADVEAELAQCNTQVADLNAQLGQCTADLNQCNADLADCEETCELPLLPANYNAKLSGSGLSAFWNAKVKISAMRKETGEISGTASIQDVLTANVIEVVAPSGSQNHWCVNAVVTSAATSTNIGSNLILYVRDTFSGRDLLSSLLGTGLSCDTAVPTEPFEQVCKSSFKGKVRCDSDQCC